MDPMISNMAKPTWVKLSGITEDSAQDELAKEIFKKIKSKYFEIPVPVQWFYEGA